MPKRPRRSTMVPLPHTGHGTPVLFLASVAASFFTYLHFGYSEQATKRPKRPSRSINFPSLHFGQCSPISFGGSISFPSIVRAPAHSGNREQLKNFPFFPNLITILLPHTGHRSPPGASPNVVNFSMSSFASTS